MSAEDKRWMTSRERERAGQRKEEGRRSRREGEGRAVDEDAVRGEGHFLGLWEWGWDRRRGEHPC